MEKDELTLKKQYVTLSSINTGEFGWTVMYIDEKNAKPFYGVCISISKVFKTKRHISIDSCEYEWKDAVNMAAKTYAKIERPGAPAAEVNKRAREVAKEIITRTQEYADELLKTKGLDFFNGLRKVKKDKK